MSRPPWESECGCVLCPRHLEEAATKAEALHFAEVRDEEEREEVFDHPDAGETR